MIRPIGLAVALSLTLGGCVIREVHYYPVEQHASPAPRLPTTPGAIVADLPPPEPIAEVAGLAPDGCWDWIDGYWNWDGASWQWAPGRWAICTPAYEWVAPSYAVVEGGCEYVPGYYVPRGSVAIRDHRDDAGGAGGPSSVRDHRTDRSNDVRDHRTSSVRDHRGAGGAIRSRRTYDNIRDHRTNPGDPGRVDPDDVPDRPWLDRRGAAAAAIDPPAARPAPAYPAGNPFEVGSEVPSSSGTWGANDSPAVWIGPSAAAPPTGAQLAPLPPTPPSAPTWSPPNGPASRPQPIVERPERARPATNMGWSDPGRRPTSSDVTPRHDVPAHRAIDSSVSRRDASSDRVAPRPSSPPPSSPSRAADSVRSPPPRAADRAPAASPSGGDSRRRHH